MLLAEPKKPLIGEMAGDVSLCAMLVESDTKNISLNATTVPTFQGRKRPITSNARAAALLISSKLSGLPDQLDQI